MHDILKHLVSHDRFEIACCKHCADAVWVARLKDHIAEDHPEVAKYSRAGGGRGADQTVRPVVVLPKPMPHEKPDNLINNNNNNKSPYEELCTAL